MGNRISVIAGVFALVLGAAGCKGGWGSSVATVTWAEADPTIQPSVMGPRGLLEVDTEVTASQDDSPPRNDPFWLYDEKGDYLGWERNDSALPIPLPPGRYCVVSRVGGVLRKVQVRIAPDAKTHVTEEDLTRAPEAPPSKP